ncbi:hypothetical protein RhiirA4_471403 [Rhizophagus irregularis]|uniref:F-box domain-containing protein n=1 Tax=Rhizophagus irregularis TaxID=588596 RepID=A0A2I1H328_9GLOM|nr:hypothetical protein RhiirA4_471403 [Rhizophagus irregularis]
MSELNEDVLYLIFKQFDDKNTLFSYVIISHLSNVSRNKIEEHKLLTTSYQSPLFNYISFCRHLNLNEIQKLVSRFYRKSLIKTLNKMLSLFINENMKFTHLYIHQKFDKIHFIDGAESCFSGVEFLSCSTKISDNILSNLVKTCKSIKELELTIRAKHNNYGIVTLIEAQKKLFNVSITSLDSNYSFYSTIKNSLVRHANTIRYFKLTKQPTTNILSSFYYSDSLIPAQALTDLIENTNGSLFKIKIEHSCKNEVENKRIIQAIYRNCPNLKYLKLLVRNSNIIEFKTLLVNCQYLDGLFILTDYDDQFNWDRLFKILTESSSTRKTSHEPCHYKSIVQEISTLNS